MNGLIRVKHFDNLQSRDLLHVRFFVHISQMPASIRRYSIILTYQVLEACLRLHNVRGT